jgi:hypothetical protein
MALLIVYLQQLEEVRTLWKNHSICSQKTGNSVPGIPESNIIKQMFMVSQSANEAD